MMRLAIYGGTFDPVHIGHLKIAECLLRSFHLDEFVFVPAFHAPHKKNLKLTPAIDRFTMLALATNSEPSMSVSKIEIEAPQKPYTIETITRLKDLLPDARLFFVMGADSWEDIRTWREWEDLLLLTDQIVMTRPGHELELDHITEAVRERIVDLRGLSLDDLAKEPEGPHIFFTDEVEIDISGTEIRNRIKNNDDDWRDHLTAEVAKYIEKYDLYR